MHISIYLHIDENFILECCCGFVCSIGLICFKDIVAYVSVLIYLFLILISFGIIASFVRPNTASRMQILPCI